ncbi:PaaI family thioesterase [Amycolatopsis alba]|uniref:DUF4442 domain-containing protein n=1 Tax=Amycolatopsis alba DSM 44262 TaxID=1125972 RepID=A0A229RET7_AMYAL|nr:PaaI family thioesterase [Amycolatopsis alba]OXM45183.1 DUF4442 domain-containing protein [Amycolatopsis alba DSM 44262]
MTEESQHPGRDGVAHGPVIDYDQLRSLVEQAVPFNRFTGVELVELADGRAKARLGLVDDLRNHVGTMHAAALFQVAEFAAASAFVGAFAVHMNKVTFVARKAEIDYSGPARGDVEAIGKLTGETAEVLREVSERGHTRTGAVGEARDPDGVVVATVRVTFDVRPLDEPLAVDLPVREGAR